MPDEQEEYVDRQRHPAADEADLAEYEAVATADDRRERNHRRGVVRGLRGDPSVRGYLRRAILRAARSPEDVAYVRSQLGLEPGVEWWVFSRLWARTAAPEARLALVRRWLRVAPEDVDLRLRLLALLEETGALPEARRVARELRADPLADARARTALGEFWLRQGDEDEARRVFSEIVEHTPLDPWARRRLGDLYRAHGWADDAYREYQTLARLRPNEDEVLLLLARAAADAGRIDEALRLEQRVSEAAEPGDDGEIAGAARLWSLVRLSRLAEDSGTDAAALRRRLRETGALRDPPDALVLLTFEHPDDAPGLSIRWPSADAAGSGEEAGVRPLLPAELGSVRSGIRAIRIGEREPGEHLLEVTRSDTESLRDWAAELTVIVHPGTAEQRVLRQPVTLGRTERTRRFVLTDADALTPAP
jgi:Ca-activated chloride channel family protein